MTKRFPTPPSNPVTRYFSWNGAEDAGFVSYWDGEKEVKMEFPFVFLPLDKLSCITGFNKSQEENIYSNEVRNTQKEVLNVRVGKSTFAQGLYQDIKDSIKAKGGKFTSSVYIAYKDELGDLQIGNIKFKGSSLGPWIDLQNSQADLSTNAVVIKGSELDESGAIKFRYPVFGVKEVTPETNAEADKLFDRLSEYLDYKVDRNEIEVPEDAPPIPSDEDLYGDMEEEMDDLPF